MQCLESSGNSRVKNQGRPSNNLGGVQGHALPDFHCCEWSALSTLILCVPHALATNTLVTNTHTTLSHIASHEIKSLRKISVRTVYKSHKLNQTGHPRIIIIQAVIKSGEESSSRIKRDICVSYTYLTGNRGHWQF